MRRMIVIGLGVTIALAGCQKKAEPAKTSETPAGPAAATAPPAPPPMRKAGLWSQTVTTEGRSQTMKLCLDAAAADKMAISNQAPDQSACAKHTVTPISGGFHFESECDLGPGGKTVTTGDATGDFGASYTVKVASVTTGAEAPSANGHHDAAIEAKWEGACPAGMKPGDMQLPNGMTINPAAMAGSMGATKGR
jgi:hypothetical protein